MVSPITYNFLFSERVFKKRGVTVEPCKNALSSELAETF